VFHCLRGTLEQANEVLNLDHLVSFTGIVTFKNGAERPRGCRPRYLWKFMVETDCPYLAPVAVSRLKGLSRAHAYRGRDDRGHASRAIQEVAEATTNRREFFPVQSRMTIDNGAPSYVPTDGSALRPCLLLLTLFIASVRAPDTRHQIVSSAWTKIALSDRGNLMAIYPVSTSIIRPWVTGLAVIALLWANSKSQRKS